MEIGNGHILPDLLRLIDKTSWSAEEEAMGVTDLQQLLD